MSNLKNLAEKTVRTFREDGISRVGEKAKLYLKRRQEVRMEGQYARNTFREVLFINGCDEHLPHPGRYRVSHQREQLESLGVTTGEVYYRNLHLDTLGCYRVFIFFRCPLTDEIQEFVTRAKELNKTVLYDVDDLVIDTIYTDMIPYLDTMGEEERQQYDEGVRSMGKLLRMCDGAITTTSCLAHELEQYVPQVLVNRNVASEEMVKLSLEALERRMESMGEEAEQDAAVETEAGVAREEQEEFRLSSPVRLGYFSGSITHNDDFDMILPVLVKLLELYEKLELHLVGELNLPEALEPYRERIVVHPFTDWRNLPRMISQVDINLAPLVNTTFNRAKSENKWMEAALVRVPTVASDMGAFHEMVENGKTGILCQNEEQWEEALRALIEQPHYRQMIGTAAFDYCSQFCVTAHTGMELLDFLKEQETECIAFLLPGFQVSGGVMVALQHCRILQKAGWDVMLLSIDERGKERWYEFEDCRFPVLNGNSCKVLGPVDCGVATMWSTVQWLENYPAVRQKKYLVQNYEMGFYEPGNPLRMQARSTYGAHSGLSYITISRWCEEWLREAYGQEVRYAPNGLELEKFAGECRKMDGKIRILIEGDSSAKHKNVDESFRIVEKLDPEKYEVWYMAYNGAPKDWYWVDRFLSQVHYEQVGEIYRQCDILLKSSVLESFSYPPLEMMAAGGFAVAVLNEGNREYLVDGENCLTYPLGDIEKGVEAIERISQDAELRERLFLQGRKTAEERDWKLIQKEVELLYR